MQNTVAGYYVDAYNYEGNMLNIKIDTAMPDDQIAVVNINNCRKGWMEGDEVMLTDETPQSSRELRESINGSFGIAIEDVGYQHIIMTNIS